MTGKSVYYHLKTLRFCVVFSENTLQSEDLVANSEMEVDFQELTVFYKLKLRNLPVKISREASKHSPTPFKPLK